MEVEATAAAADVDTDAVDAELREGCCSGGLDGVSTCAAPVVCGEGLSAFVCEPSDLFGCEEAADGIEVGDKLAVLA